MTCDSSTTVAVDSAPLFDRTHRLHEGDPRESAIWLVCINISNLYIIIRIVQ